ncbi:MAG: AhpC/TSA family protein [Bacteroidales bacterium]|nr:AhpC/TSA family protein [Bacteroidales bacterium]
MKTTRTILKAAVILMAVASVFSCSRGARITGVVGDDPNDKIVVTLLDAGRYNVLDTVTTDKNGAFKYVVDVKKGQPEFIYLFHGDTRIASLLLQNGEKAIVKTDTLGNYSVTGSPETEKLMEVERDEAEFSNKFASTTAKLNDLDPNSPAAADVRRDLTKQYISYYRSRVQYVMSNPKSLTVIPVLNQVVGDNLPVFGQSTDAIHFRNCCDSLMTVYPDSKYVKALADETKRRQNLLELNSRISNANEQAYVDIELPDVKGQRSKLSDIDAKVVMVYFWSSEVSGQNMFNFEVLRPIYSEFHPKGFEIYAVSLDTDKTLWATTLRNQQIDWVNVCDGLGSASPSVALYNVTSVPMVFFLVDGNLSLETSVTDGPSLRRFLQSNLK